MRFYFIAVDKITSGNICKWKTKFGSYNFIMYTQHIYSTYKFNCVHLQLFPRENTALISLALILNARSRIIKLLETVAHTIHIHIYIQLISSKMQIRLKTIEFPVRIYAVMPNCAEPNQSYFHSVKRSFLKHVPLSQKKKVLA